MQNYHGDKPSWWPEDIDLAPPAKANRERMDKVYKSALNHLRSLRD